MLYASKPWILLSERVWCPYRAFDTVLHSDPAQQIGLRISRDTSTSSTKMSSVHWSEKEGGSSLRDRKITATSLTSMEVVILSWSIRETIRCEVTLMRRVPQASADLKSLHDDIFQV